GINQSTASLGQLLGPLLGYAALGAGGGPAFGLLLLVLGIGGTVVTIRLDRKSTRLNSSHVSISYTVFCLKKKKQFFAALQLDLHKQRSNYLSDLPPGAPAQEPQLLTFLLHDSAVIDDIHLTGGAAYV